MTHGSLFSGMGGFDLASEWMGWQNIFHCEWNHFGQKVLKHYWPKAISYADITKTDFTIHRGTIDILTGGFPCQPYSVAGKRKGKEDERHLWPEMLRAIREIQPSWIVGENVGGLVNWSGGLVFDEVQTDLETQGYEVTPFLLPACGKNAPHQRDRIWFIAHSESNGDRKRSLPHQREDSTRKMRAERINELHPLLNGNVADFNSAMRKGWEIGNEASEGSESVNEQSGRCDKFYRTDWSKFPSQPALCNGDDGLSSRLDGITFPKWRNESIKAGGNAIVPQVAHQIFKAIEAMRQG